MEFYQIELDRDASCSMIARFDWGTYNWEELTEVGHPVEWPENMQLPVAFVMEEGYPERLVDYVDIPTLRFPAISARARDVILQIAPDAVQLLPLQLVHKQTRQIVGTYWIMNVIRPIEALDFEHTEWFPKPQDFSNPAVYVYIRRAALERDKVETEPLFQLLVNGQAYKLFASAQFRDTLRDAGADDGFKFVPVQAV